ncbi:MAG: TIGR02757 family protein [Salibacteraceae bacterium]
MKALTKERIDFLEEAYRHFATKDFIPNDPISVPHQYSSRFDIEISAFLTATIAWGNRTSIIRSARKLLALMDHAPYDFILHHSPRDLKRMSGFVHRTFNGTDLLYFVERLSAYYREENGLEMAFSQGKNTYERLCNFHHSFFNMPHPERSVKHISNTSKGSAAKRLNMFLRWMVRPPDEGCDFGLWKSMTPAELMVPLDVHTATIARKLGLLHRKTNDWKAVVELTDTLKSIDSNDPVKFDYALFGLGVNGRL